MVRLEPGFLNDPGREPLGEAGRFVRGSLLVAPRSSRVVKRAADLSEAAESISAAVPHTLRSDVASMRRLPRDAQHGLRPTVHHVQGV